MIQTESKQILLSIISIAVLIIACLFDVTSKIVKRYSLKEELESSATYLEQRKNNEQK